ncbi:hypothetical protein O2N63_09070 [Aliiroseovarius sp. KMU-50]|uniref:Uncharacterized protein n=1 Tax=Aliiroseovarius salicola TaxID=3009082 RepID=A0ABT4W149_9RHOB|nr:hypothetical protein [Aliiroseovarius sp. KMU-50]MDA5094238.1 hypothetical protein [Aliiroseovarius sp. KMU-50]
MPHLPFEFGFGLNRGAKQRALVNHLRGAFVAFAECRYGGDHMRNLEVGINAIMGFTERCQFLREMLRVGQGHFDAVRESIGNRACKVFEIQLRPQLIPTPITLSAQDQEIKTGTGRLCWTSAHTDIRKRTSR